MEQRIWDYMRAAKARFHAPIENGRRLRRLERQAADQAALTKLWPLLPGSFIPWTSYAIRPAALLRVVNELAFRDALMIVEFGSGLSTMVLAKLLRQRGDGGLISFEDDARWSALVSEALSKEELSRYAQVVHAPLSETSLSAWSGTWYDVDMVHNHLEGNRVDALLVDGPKGADSGTGDHPRLPAAIVLEPYFTDLSVVFLDDANRKGESTVLDRWTREPEKRFQRIGTEAGLAVPRRGPVPAKNELES